MRLDLPRQVSERQGDEGEESDFESWTTGLVQPISSSSSPPEPLQQKDDLKRPKLPPVSLQVIPEKSIARPIPVSDGHLNARPSVVKETLSHEDTAQTSPHASL
jgi:hypothetical protein